MKIYCQHQTLDLAKRPHVMGILNVTPDSFSDGGELTDSGNLKKRVQEMIAAGVDILDIGGESTRPFAPKVVPEEELQRVIPAITAIRQNFTVPISIDTTKALVARKALEAGADIINDISALCFDQKMVMVAREFNAPVIMMHMQGTPGNMQKNPQYKDVVKEITDFLQERLDWAVEKGLNRSQLIVDPGIGFGKTLEHNLLILKHLNQFTTLKVPLLLGHSRKAFIGTVLGLDNPRDRDNGTAAISALATAAGVNIIRVHDVKSTVQAMRLAAAIYKS
jgi:dihydropteroate synthase